MGDVVQKERVIGGGLQGQRAAAEETVGDVLVQLDVGDPGQGQVVADAADDAGAGDDALGGDGVGAHVPLQPGQEQQRNAHDEDRHPDRQDAPGLPGGGGHDRGDDADHEQEDLDDEPPQEDLDVGVHVPHHDLVAAQQLLRQCHAPIVPGRRGSAHPTGQEYPLERASGGAPSPAEHAHADRGDDRCDPQDDEGRQVAGAQRQDQTHRQALGGLLVAGVPPRPQARRRRLQEGGR